jgi:hypothetical protein
MGLRDRLESGAARAAAAAQEAAGSALKRAPDDGFQSLRALLRDDDEKQRSIERFLLALVRTVRDDEGDEDLSARDVFETARSRRRRLGLVSFGAGPLVGVANQVSDLYCDTATVCELAELHDLGLSDEQLAAHMLVLWGVADGFAVAESAMRHETVGVLLGARLQAHTGLEREMTKRKAAKALWDARDAVGDARKSASSGAVSTVMFTGRHTKRLIKQAEEQLGIVA